METLQVDALLNELRLTDEGLAQVLGISQHLRSNSSWLSEPIPRSRLQNFAGILNRAAPWAGSVQQAFSWFSTQSLPSFGNQTPAELLRADRADAVNSYLDRVGYGGYT